MQKPQQSIVSEQLFTNYFDWKLCQSEQPATELALWLQSQDKGSENRLGLAVFPLSLRRPACLCCCLPSCLPSSPGLQAADPGPSAVGAHPPVGNQGSWNGDAVWNVDSNVSLTICIKSRYFYSVFREQHTQDVVLVWFFLIKATDISGKISQDFSL